MKKKKNQKNKIFQIINQRRQPIRLIKGKRRIFKMSMQLLEKKQCLVFCEFCLNAITKRVNSCSMCKNIFIKIVFDYPTECIFLRMNMIYFCAIIVTERVTLHRKMMRMYTIYLKENADSCTKCF